MPASRVRPWRNSLMSSWSGHVCFVEEGVIKRQSKVPVYSKHSTTLFKAGIPE